MCACVCVCVHARALLCMYAHTYVCMHIHMYVCTQRYLFGKKVEGRTHETKQMTKAILAYFIKALKQTVQVLHHQKRRQSLSLSILRFG